MNANVPGWSDGSVVKSTSYYSRGPRFNPLDPDSGSQLLVTQVSGYPFFLLLVLMFTYLLV